VIFPEFNYQWLVDEVKENLPKELDFEHEAANAERCRANLASTKSRLGGRWGGAVGGGLWGVGGVLLMQVD